MLGRIIGRLVREPEITRGQKDGKEWVKAVFSVAENNHFGTESRAESTFYDCVAWNKKAEWIEKYVVKGKPIVIEGYLEQDEYTAKDGANKRVWKLYPTLLDFVPVDNTAKKQAPKGDKDNQIDSTPTDTDDIPF